MSAWYASTAAYLWNEDPLTSDGEGSDSLMGGGGGGGGGDDTTLPSVGAGSYAGC